MADRLKPEDRGAGSPARHAGAKKLPAARMVELYIFGISGGLNDAEHLNAAGTWAGTRAPLISQAVRWHREQEGQVMFEDSRSLKNVAVAMTLGVLMFGESCATGVSRSKAPPNGEMPIIVEKLNGGRIRLERAGHKLVLNLARQISGCTGRTYDLTVNEEYEAGVDFEIIDETERVPYTYLLLLATAPPNCNVEGECGAGGWDSTLIWLKVTKDLSLAGKQAFAIDDCRAGRIANVVETGGGDYFSWIQAKDLPWIGDVLTIEYQEEGKDSIHRLIYDRQDPGAGLQRAP